VRRTASPVGGGEFAIAGDQGPSLGRGQRQNLVVRLDPAVERVGGVVAAHPEIRRELPAHRVEEDAGFVIGGRAVVGRHQPSRNARISSGSAR